MHLCRFTLNDDWLKRVGGGNYFEELLARIRDICASETDRVVISPKVTRTRKRYVRATNLSAGFSDFGKDDMPG